MCHKLHIILKQFKKGKKICNFNIILLINKLLFIFIHYQIKDKSLIHPHFYHNKYSE